MDNLFARLITKIHVW